MKPMVFEPITGANYVTVYPYIRKIDLMSSNSYILSCPNQISLIDPGGMQDQIDIIGKEISHLQEDLKRPVVVYLTHVHIDHWFSLKQEGTPKPLKNAFIAVQEEGATALENADGFATLSQMLGRPMTRMPVDIRLLTKEDKVLEFGLPFDLGGFKLDNAILSKEIAGGLMMHSQVLSLGEGDSLQIYHIPGHSPDSICLRLGSLLFIGDFFFASNPGVAGVHGWSHQDLMESIQKIYWILENEAILLCLSGHGKPIEVETAKKTLAVMYKDAVTLKDLGEIDGKWARQTADYAQDLIRELDRIFIIIAGRLAVTAHIIAELEEVAESKNLEAIINPQALDELFVDFHRFAQDLRSGNKLDWEMVHKAGQVVGRLENLFERKKLGSFMDQSLLARAGRLLSDYSVTYRGYRPPYYVSLVDVNELIAEIMEQLKNTPHEDESILFAETEEEYFTALKSRIAHVNLFEDFNLTFQSDARSPIARMDRERFKDILMDILERFRAYGWKELKMTTSVKDGWVIMRISGSGSSQNHPLGQSIKFFERDLALCGALLENTLGPEGPSVEIELSAAEE